MFFLIAASVKIALVEIAILCFLFNSVEFLTHLSLSIQLLHLGFLFVCLLIHLAKSSVAGNFYFLFMNSNLSKREDLLGWLRQPFKKRKEPLVEEVLVTSTSPWMQRILINISSIIERSNSISPSPILNGTFPSESTLESCSMTALQS